MNELANAQQLIHRYIILDLTLKTLELDQRHVELMKAKFAFDEWFTHKIDFLYQEFLIVQKNMRVSKITFIESVRIDEVFTQYSFKINGKLMNYRYSSVALRNWTNEEVKRLLHMPYRTSDLSR